MFPLSIESGLAYMHSIGIPTNDDLQQYPHVFFTSPDIWDASVLDHGITPALLEEIHQEADDSLLKKSMFDEFGNLHQQVVQHLDVFWDSSPTETGEHTFHAHLHQTNPSQGLDVLSLNMVFSRNVSSPGTLFSTFLGGMNLLLLILSLVTHLPSMMELPWPNSLLERTL